MKLRRPTLLEVVLAVVSLAILATGINAWRVDRVAIDQRASVCRNYLTLHKLISESPRTSPAVLKALGFTDAGIALLEEDGKATAASQLKILGPPPEGCQVEKTPAAAAPDSRTR